MTVIALDIGGTKISAALIKNDLFKIKSIRIPTRAKKGKKYVLDSLTIVIKSLLQTKYVVTAIACSVPGIVSDSGVLLSCGNLPSGFKGFNLKLYLETKFKVPVVIENDANCFALAESYCGAGKKYNQVLGVIWGSGVGAGYVHKNQHAIHRVISRDRSHSFFLRGRDGGALELGEIPIKIGNTFVSLEEEVGGIMLTKKHKVDNVSLLFEKKPLIANKVIERFAQGLAIAISLFNPQVIVLGGGVSNMDKKYYALLTNKVRKLVFTSAHKKNLKILKYAISDDAGLIGAALLALKKKL
ncbi:MAG: ROK family protein [Nanoarchaeota archaeon]|nr:ROK family protein [Nanoarchaeota archaeon]